MFKEFLEKSFPCLFSTKTYLAHGVEESFTKYPLDKARYLLMASYIHEEGLRLARPVRVLDIGCSVGMMLLYCNKNGSATEFYGIDILRESLDVALQRGYKSVLLRNIRALPLPHKDNFFDVIICSHILEHLESPGELLEELQRLVSKRGVLLVGVPVGLLPGILWRQHITPLYNKKKRMKESLKRFEHVSFFTLPKLVKLLKKYGFVAEEARGDYLIRAKKFFLENYRWWYEFNQLYGRLFPGILGHVTVKARFKPNANSHRASDALHRPVGRAEASGS